MFRGKALGLARLRALPEEYEEASFFLLKEQ